LTLAGSGAPPRLLCLDLWHTLVYLEPDAEEAYMRAQVDLAVSLLASSPPSGATAPVGSTALRALFEEVYSGAVAASQEGRSVGPVAQMEEAGRRAGRQVDPQRYVDGLRELVRRTPFRPAPDAVEVVERLRKEGWATAIISNTVGEPGQAFWPILQRMGLVPAVDAFVFSDEEPWTKPAPEIFREALRRVGASPERSVHVGDGWVDIEGARRAGLRAGILYTGLQHYGAKYRRLFLPEGWSQPETPYRFGSWPELPGVLRTIL